MSVSPLLFGKGVIMSWQELGDGAFWNPIFFLPTRYTPFTQKSLRLVGIDPHGPVPMDLLRVVTKGTPVQQPSSLTPNPSVEQRLTLPPLSPHVLILSNCPNLLLFLTSSKTTVRGSAPAFMVAWSWVVGGEAPGGRKRAWVCLYLLVINTNAISLGPALCPQSTSWTWVSVFYQTLQEIVV